jgi:D-serine deaminase-like pyridoxal phosphate-dependent protein
MSSIYDLLTPALVLDWPTAQRNIERAAAFVEDKQVRLRPHFKNHKRVALAHKQLAAGGCVGMTAATIFEAIALVDGGIDDVLIANQIVNATSINRLIELAERANVRVAIDNLENAKAIAEAAKSRGIEVGVLIEVDIGMSRCGLAPGVAVLGLVEKIAPLDGIRFDGLQAYEGHAVGILDTEERESVAIASMEKAIDTKRQIEAAGHECRIISGAGTGSFRATGTLDDVSELQIGSYVTMDWSYKERVGDQFDVALTVLAHVISVNGDNLVLNAGVKSIGHEMGAPKLRDYPQAEIPSFGSEEHTSVHFPGHKLKIGDLVHVMPSHCCMTCSLHRDMFVYEGENITDTWPAAIGYPR